MKSYRKYNMLFYVREKCYCRKFKMLEKNVIVESIIPTVGRSCGWRELDSNGSRKLLSKLLTNFG